MALSGVELERLTLKGINLVPKEKCIILDLDSTLVWTWDPEQLKKVNVISEYIDFDKISYSLTERRGDGTIKLLAKGIKRPHVDIFLTFCFRYFKKVCVWSAGTEGYVKRLSEHLFQNHPTPDIIYHRGDCTSDMRKPLSKMYDDPLAEGIMNSENTVILDDNPTTYIYNTENAIRMPVYAANASIEDIDRNDDTFFRLMIFFLSPEFIECDDVKTIDKHILFPIK